MFATNCGLTVRSGKVFQLEILKGFLDVYCLTICLQNEVNFENLIGPSKVEHFLGIF